MAEDSLLLAEKISTMIIDQNPYMEISKILDDAEDSNSSIDWGIVGDRIVAILQSGVSGIFRQINFLDFAMQAYERDGEDSILKKFEAQFTLAQIESDQGGLKRKFELYEDLVESASSRLKENSTENPFYYWLTRPLNRLAQLTQRCKGREAAEPLWHRLVKVSSEAGEIDGVFSVMKDNADWFIKKNPELFPEHKD